MSVKAAESRSGPMVVSMKDIGLRVKPMVKEDSFMLMATCMTVTGRMTRRMVMEFTRI